MNRKLKAKILAFCFTVPLFMGKTGIVSKIYAFPMDKKCRTDYDTTQKAKNQALSHAAVNGNVAEVEKLIESGADVNAKNRIGSTPLILAALYGHIDVVKKLVENAADVNALLCMRDRLGDTALHVALFLGKFDIAKFLIDIGDKGNLGIRNAECDTPLNKLMKSFDLRTDDIEKTEMVAYLIENGAMLYINAPDNDGRTPLHVALLNSHCPAAVISLLLESGADPNAVDGDGRKPFDYAPERRNEVCTELDKDFGV